MEDYHPSIVRYYSKQRKEHCGYCSSKISSFAYGLDAHVLTVEDYQNMIDRGWRRCAKYCYKAIMDKTCCPLYTIRCAAKDFKLSRTQKRVLRRFNQFLLTGKITKNKIYKETELAEPNDANYYLDKKKTCNINMEDVNLSDVITKDNQKCDNVVDIQSDSVNSRVFTAAENTKATESKPSKDKSKKAKFLRIERKRLKLEKLGLSQEEIAKKLVEKKKYPVVKTLEDYIMEGSKSELHNLKISLVRSYPPSEDFSNTFLLEYDLYKKYQISMHKSPPEKITQHQFERFLFKSPLQNSSTYGSYHQQYWLDNKLIAVGVIDILPKCVSSVYFFYDPDYSYLSLGCYGALREIEFTRKLSSHFPDINFYYMGFYIHSCVKMRYKIAFKPSYLLCPEVYTWHPVKDCLPKLNKAKYSRLNDDIFAVDVNSKISFSDVLILYNKTAMLLVNYLNQKKCSQAEVEEIMEYANLVGKSCTKKMLLFRT